MANSDPDKVVRITLDGSGMPVPDENRVKIRKDTQKVKWCADFQFTIEMADAAALPSSPGDGGCAHGAKSRFFGEAVGTVIKYSIRANGRLNDPEIEIQP